MRKDCYAKFKEQYPDTFQDILDMHDEISSLGGVPQTVSQRAQAFQRLQKRVTNIVSDFIVGVSALMYIHSCS